MLLWAIQSSDIWKLQKSRIIRLLHPHSISQELNQKLVSVDDPGIFTPGKSNVFGQAELILKKGVGGSTAGSADSSVNAQFAHYHSTPTRVWVGFLTSGKGVTVVPNNAGKLEAYALTKRCTSVVSVVPVGNQFLKTSSNWFTSHKRSWKRKCDYDLPLPPTETMKTHPHHGLRSALSFAWGSGLSCDILVLNENSS